MRPPRIKAPMKGLAVADGARHLQEVIRLNLQAALCTWRSPSDPVLDGFLKGRPVQERVSVERCTMSFHGFDAEVQSRRDGLIAISLSEQLNNLALTRGQAIMRKLELKSFADIVRFAIRNRIIEA